jgi:hypothetical protein
LWRNVFQTPVHDSRRSGFYMTPDQDWVRGRSAWNGEVGGLGTTRAVDCLALWVMEAMTLAPAGMPEKSFSLVLDAEPEPEVCSEIFRDSVQGAAALQIAWEMLCRLEIEGLKDRADMADMSLPCMFPLPPVVSVSPR